MRNRVLTLVASIWVASFGCALAQATASPPPDPNPQITARAKDWLHRLQTANIDHTQLDATMNTALTSDVVTQIASQMAPLGDPLSFAYLKTLTSGDLTVYVYRATFTTRVLEEDFAVDKDGKIAGIHFAAPQ